MFVVAGVTGNTGSVVAESLLSQGKKVRVIVRDAKKGEPWKAKGAEVSVAELGDQAALTRALTGAEGAYLLVPPRVQSSSVLADNEKVTDAIAASVEAAKVPHVVLLSSIGADLPAGTGPIVSLHVLEKKLAKTAAKVTAVRAGAFMENWGGSLYGLAQSKLPTFQNLDAAYPQVATRDIGLTAAKLLVEGATEKSSIVELSGPREYSPKDVAEAASRVTKRTIVAEQGPIDYMVPALVGAGLSEDMSKLYREMTEAFNGGKVSWSTSGPRKVRGTIGIETVLEGMISAPKH